MEYRYSFDSTIVSNPSNWQDIKVKYVRDKVTRGLFTRHTTELYFISDAYAYIVALFDTSPCSTVDALIERRCGQFDSWTTEFTGIISIKDSVYDHKSCFAKVVIEENAGSEIFLTHKNVSVNFNHILGNNGQNYIGTYTVLGNLTDLTGFSSNWFFLVPFGEPHTGIAFPGDVFATRVKDVFLKIIRSISDNNFSFVSDFFDTLRLPHIIRIQIDTTGMVAGDNINIQFTDQFGHEHIIDCEFQTVLATQITLGNTILSSSDDHPNMKLSEPYDVVITNPSGNIIRCDVYFYFAIIAETASAVNAASVTVTTLQEYQRGGQYMSIANGLSIDPATALPNEYWYDDVGNLVPDNDETFQITFDDLFNWLNNIMNLGFSIEYDSGLGEWVVRIEPMDYFYSQTSTVTFRNIRDAILQYDVEQINGMARIGCISDTENPYVYQSTDPGIEDLSSVKIYKANTMNCKSFWDFRNQNDRYSGTGEKMAAVAFSQQTYPNDMFVNEGDGLGTVTQKDFKFNVFDIGSATLAYSHWANISFVPDAILSYHLLSLPNMDYTIYSNQHTYTIGGGYSLVQSTSPGVLLSGIAYKPKIMKFNRFITNAEFQLIQSSQMITVNETDDAGNDKDAIILNVTHRISDGFTEFEVLINI